MSSSCLHCCRIHEHILTTSSLSNAPAWSDMLQRVPSCHNSPCNRNLQERAYKSPSAQHVHQDTVHLSTPSGCILLLDSSHQVVAQDINGILPAWLHARPTLCRLMTCWICWDVLPSVPHHKPDLAKDDLTHTISVASCQACAHATQQRLAAAVQATCQPKGSCVQAMCESACGLSSSSSSSNRWSGVTCTLPSDRVRRKRVPQALHKIGLHLGPLRHCGESALHRPSQTQL